MTSSARLIVSVGADLKEFLDGSDKLEGKLAGFGKAAAIGATAIAGAVAGIGAGLFKLGTDFDSAFDSIRIGTGKTGEELEDLKTDFRDTLANVPDDMDKVSKAITELHQRTGASGKALGGMAKQLLNLSRITDTDLSENIEQSTRVFGDWGIALEDGGTALDKIFRASQATGAGVNQLMGKIVQFGAPLRAMNFSFEDSLALLGKWEKEGVNTELVLGSLRIAMGKFAKDNIPMRQGLDDTIKKIQELGPGAKSTALAMEIFGARAGPDMAAAILEGRLSIGDLVKDIEGSEETISGVADETKDASEKMQEAWNKVTLAVEPLAVKVFEFVGQLATDLGPAIDEITRIFGIWDKQGMEPALEEIEKFNPALAAVVRFLSENVKPILISIGALAVTIFAAWAVSAIAAAVATIIAFAPVILILGVLGLAVAGLAITWDEQMGYIREATRQVVNAVIGLLNGAIQKVDALIGLLNHIPGVEIPMLGHVATTSHPAGASLLGGEGEEFSFHRGGIAPGPIGMPLHATLLGGETVLPIGAGGGIGGVTVHLNMGGVTVTNEADEQRLAQTIVQHLEEALDRQIGMGTPFPHGLNR